MHFFAKLNADPNLTVTYSLLMYSILYDVNGKNKENKETKEKKDNNNNNNNNNSKDDGLISDIAQPDLDHHAVKIHYQGRMIDGRVFDSSFDSKACVFPAKSLIKGLHQGIGQMKRGTTYEFYIPPHLAYSEDGSGSLIPPHEPLIFRVKLIDFWKDQDIFKKDTRRSLSFY